MNDFISKMQLSVEKFHKIGLQQFITYKRLYGSYFILKRVSASSKYNKVYGATYSSTLPGDSEVTMHSVKLIVNLADMIMIWNTQSQDLEVYDIDELLKEGDIIYYERGNNIYSFKVGPVQSFTDLPQILYKFTLSPFKEQLKTKIPKITELTEYQTNACDVINTPDHNALDWTSVDW